MLGTSKEIKNPGLNILPPGVERHVVNAGALTAFQIFPDDELEIINNEGNQIYAEVNDNGLGLNLSKIFNYFIVSIITAVALIIFLDTFKYNLISIFPNLELFLYNLYESVKDIKLFIYDLIK